MSLPKFPTPDPCLTREQSINMILVSIAMEELALSHLIETESEKMKYILDYWQHQNCCVNIDKILEVSESASKLIETVMEFQMILKKKMESALNSLPKPCPKPCPPCPKPKPNKDCSSVICRHHKYSAVFFAKPFSWYCGNALSLSKQPTSCVGISLSPSNDTEILLPNCSRFIINFNLELTPLLPSTDPVSIELKHTCPLKTLITERYHAISNRNCITVLGSIIAETLENYPHSYICIKLLSPCKVQIKSGRISVVEL